MMYAYAPDGTSVARTRSIPPASWKLKDGRWISGFDLRPDLWEAEGWLPVVDDKPALDPATQQYVSPTYEVQPTQVVAHWTVEAIPPSTLNGDQLRARITQELANNKTFLAIASPTNAQNAAQLKKLTRQVNALFRFQLADFDDISDT